jgi:hypothetical protein
MVGWDPFIPPAGRILNMPPRRRIDPHLAAVGVRDTVHDRQPASGMPTSSDLRHQKLTDEHGLAVVDCIARASSAYCVQ